MDVFDSLSFWAQNLALLLRQNDFWTPYLRYLRSVFGNAIDLAMNLYSSVNLDMRVRYAVVVLLLPALISLLSIMILRSFGYAVVVLGIWISCAVVISGIVFTVFANSAYFDDLEGTEYVLYTLGIIIGAIVLCTALFSLLHSKVSQRVRRERRKVIAMVQLFIGCGAYTG